jgi:2-keto-4-pentenoate hydratase/2-oxohepta-3-ene-1,7-dioic acid hydratase in catechol pathway
MRLATVLHDGQVHLATGVDDAQVRLLEGPADLLDLVEEGLPALLEAGSRDGTAVPLSQVRFLPPLRPPSVRDFVAFEEHVEGVVRSVTDGAAVAEEWYAAPTFYFANPHTLVGAHDDVPMPPGSSLLDFECEVAAVIGMEGRNLHPEEAHSAIVGYTILNDWSARDLQQAEMRVGLGPAKGKDFASTLGPWLVTADELEPLHDADGFLALEMSVEVNGGRVGQDLLSNMGWRFADLVAYASRGSVVRPGDVLGSGTCGNGGCLAELWGRSGAVEPPSLQVGDVVTMTVEGIGMIRNRIVPGPTAQPIPRARQRPRDRRRPAARPDPGSTWRNQ